MKLKDIFEIETIDNSQFMVCLDSSVLSGMIELNETAAFIVQCLKENTTINEIASKISGVYNISAEDATPGVVSIINQLSQLNALEE